MKKWIKKYKQNKKERKENNKYKKEEKKKGEGRWLDGRGGDELWKFWKIFKLARIRGEREVRAPHKLKITLKLAPVLLALA